LATTVEERVVLRKQRRDRDDDCSRRNIIFR
jgi:hypothetical protein